MTTEGKDAEKMTDDLEKLVRQFEESQEQGRENRELCERDRDYYDGIQLTDEEVATLNSRGQPPVVFNRIAPKVDSVLGFERKMRTDPKAYPRTPKHEQEAESITDAIRYVLDDQRWDQKRSDVAENVFIEGEGAVTITVKEGRQGPDIIITHVPWDRFYADPYSRMRDYSDAAYKGVVLWMDEDEVEARWGREARDKATESIDNRQWSGDTFDDRPRRTSWADGARRRVRICQHYWRKGDNWFHAILCRAGFIDPPKESPYLDEDGNPSCPLVAVCCNVDRENNRYGGVRRMISPQDEINKRRSKALHYMNSRQVLAEHGAVADVGRAKEELAKPDGWVEYNPDFKLELAETVTQTQFEMTMLQEAKNEIDVLGVNPALEGDVKAPSGRAVEALQQAGLAELTKYFDALRDWNWRVYRTVWNRVRQFWTEERWIRVTDDEENLRWVTLNHPITAAEQAQKMMEEGQPIPPQLEQMVMVAPQSVVGVSNPVAEMDVDIIMQDAPDSVTIQSEQFEMLVRMWERAPERVPLEMVVEASSLRSKTKQKMLETIKPPEPSPQQVEAMEIQKAGAIAEVQKTQSEAAKNVATAEQTSAATQRQQVEARIAAEFGTPIPTISV